MVFSTLFKFPAIATTYVGNFTGNCTIQLNGQAIVVINRGKEINRWPYNCIRQFRAEDESGKFSFVSGRRGPYGVAEYNFKLLSDSLVDLQSVLTEFTGAQFSAVAPGSGTDQQAPLQPQQPTSYPATMPRPSSSSSYTTSLPHHMTTGCRNDSTSSDQFPDSVFNSPARSQGPRLPPRDYTMTLPGDHSAMMGHSVDELAMRGLNRTRCSTSGSGSAFGLDIGTYSTPRPALPPPRRETKELSPEMLVAKSNSYEEAHLASQQAALGKGKGDKPALPAKKKSLFHRGKKSSKSSTSSEHVADIPEAPTNGTKPHLQTENTPPLANGKPHDKSQDTVLDTLPEEGMRIPANSAKVESPYDHLPSEKEQMEASDLANPDAGTVNPSSGPASPVGSAGKRSPDINCNNCSDLDYIPRSSPTVQVRSITPEHAQHLRKLTEKEGPARVSASLRGRRSPPDRLKKAHTLGSIAVGGVASKSAKPAIPSNIKEDDSLYNVPRDSSDAFGLYNVPKSVMDSPPSPRGNGAQDNTYANNLYSTPRSNGSSENVYSAPKPVDQSNADSSYVSNVSEEAMYKVPSSIVAEEENGVSGDQSAPHHASADESLYNVPRSLSNDMVDNAAYNDFQSTLPTDIHDDPLYNTPRPVQSRAPLSPSDLRNNYESIDIDEPTFHTLRSSRSFESLNRTRINPIERTMTSTPAFGGKPPKCEYVDIDIDKRPPALAPAKNAPLPPLPAPAGPDRIVDSVYAEITDETIARGRQVSMSSQGTIQSQNPAGHSLYNELPPTRSARYLDSSAMAQEGMAKAQELAEEEGYELFMPAVNHIKAAQYEETRIDNTYPPVSASALLQKYNINIHESGVRSRPFSESDVLEDSHNRPTKYGASVSDDFVSDEYVIVTGPDRRPKPDIVTSQNYPIVEDQYEIMSSAHANLSNHDSQYSTPNPSLWAGSGVSSVPQPQLTGAAMGITRQSSAGRIPASHGSTGSPMPPLPPRKHDQEGPSTGAGIDLDAMSPTDPDSAPLYCNFQQHERQSSSLSSSSGRSEGGAEVDGSLTDKGPLSVPMTCQSAKVKIMVGSPMDGSEAMDLKNRTRSFGNVLDHSTPPQSDTTTAGTHSRPSSHTPTPSHTPSPSPPSTQSGISLSPPVSKRHNYVNCTPKEGDESEEVPRQRTASTPKSSKRPRPLPRSSVLLRGDSTGNIM